MTKIKLFIFIIFLATSNVYADTVFSKINGAILQKECTSALKSMQQEYPQTPAGVIQASMDLGSCLSYITGVNDAFHSRTDLDSGMLENKNGKITRPYCIPVGINFEYTIRVILEFLENHPQMLEEKGSIVILDAFKKKFPCA